jgi:lysophospholipase L1-like esterase
VLLTARFNIDLRELPREMQRRLLMRIYHVWSCPAVTCAALAIGLFACGDMGNDDDTGATGVSDDELATGAPIETIHYVGRFDMSDRRAPVFEWSGSAVWTRFLGTSISAELDGSASDFEVEIDGARQPVIFHPGGDQTYVLASGLRFGIHDLKLTRRTEAFFSTSIFRGLRGALLIPTPRPRRLIEMIGDSITCGYGITGAGPDCHFSHDTEAETHAWGALTARQLGATHHAICWSGIGVSRNFNDQPGPLMPDRYGLTLPNENASPWNFRTTPQVVVINLGTNDFSVGVDPGQKFVDAMTAFVAQVRSHYPATPILLATSPMLGGTQHTTEKTYLDTVAATDSRTVVLDLPVQEASDGFGCDFHPSEITAQKMADRLEQQIRSLLGW